ncbi:MAG: SURF1 family protein [Xanthobacteraceae bacterium]
MSGQQAAVPSRGSVLRLGLFALAGVVVLLALGAWQIERLAWKENLIATLDRRLAAPHASLPPSQEWPRLTQAEAEFRRVAVRLEFLDVPPAYVYTSGSALRPDVKAPGYFVFAPARTASGETVVVNIGYVAERHKTSTPRSGEIVGYLRWPEPPNWFVTEHDASAAVWFVRDHRAMANVKGWGDGVAPFYIDQEGPVPTGGAPRPGPLNVKLRNQHFGYAMTWFGLAAALMIVFTIWAAGRRGA